jgi:hypothetical protein
MAETELRQYRKIFDRTQNGRQQRRGRDQAFWWIGTQYCHLLIA